ncbi:WD40-repeat-containing domain protein [Scleroderma yunnanense]
MLAEAPPSPLHVLRTHSDPVTTIFCSTDNERIYSGDAKGRVVLTSTRSLRPTASWLAHTDALLGIEEFIEKNQVFTHGRDNKIHVWQRPEESIPSIRQGGAATLTESSTPMLSYSIDVNALNYCRFSLLIPSPDAAREGTALIAVPNLVESSLADIWTLPHLQRLHAAIGDSQNTKFSDGRSGAKTGIIMAMHLFYALQILPSTSTVPMELRLLCAYEDGGVILHRRVAPSGTQTIEGKGWEAIWRCKLHVESVMAMVVSKDSRFALTVSADHLVGKYDLTCGKTETGTLDPGTVFRTKNPGNGAVAIRDDGRVCAVGGWDGKVRLYSTKSFKSLGTFVHHKQSCQALKFASDVSVTDKNEGDEDDMTLAEKRQRSRWLITAGKDARVSIWALMSFEKTP